MSESPKPLVHQDAERKDDDVLAREARTFLLATPTVQLVAELLTKLREADFPWWSPAVLRSIWSATDRMGWLAERPDVRQRITTSLTGLAPKAARKKAADFQASLIDSVVDDGDTSERAFEEAFSPVELAVYGPVASFWRAFRERFPWDDRRPAHREIVAWLMGALLNDKSFIDDMGRAPVMNAWDLRTSIDNLSWHTHMPVAVRAAIDDARLKREKVDPGEPFHAADDLSIALPETIAEHVPLRDLGGVLAVAERAMGLAPPAQSTSATGATGAPDASAALPSAAPTSPVSSSASGPKLASPGSASTASLASAPSSASAPNSSSASARGANDPASGKGEGAAEPVSASFMGQLARGSSTTPPRGDEAPATARGESLRELAAAAVDNLVAGQGLPPLFDDVEDLQSFVEIDPLDEGEPAGAKIVVPLNGPTRR